MTVFYVAPMLTAGTEVMARYGTPASEVSRQQIPMEGPAEAGKTYEAHLDLNPSPRELTQREAMSLLPNFARQFMLEHPGAVINYADIRRGSPQSCVVQFKVYPTAFAIPAIPVIIAWLIAILAAVVVAVIIGLIVVPVAKILYSIVTTTVPKPIIWLVYLIPVAIVGYLGYRFVIKPMMARKEKPKEEAKAK